MVNVGVAREDVVAALACPSARCCVCDARPLPPINPDCVTTRNISLRAPSVKCLTMLMRLPVSAPTALHVRRSSVGGGTRKDFCGDACKSLVDSARTAAQLVARLLPTPESVRAATSIPAVVHAACQASKEDCSSELGVTTTLDQQHSGLLFDLTPNNRTASRLVKP